MAEKRDISSFTVILLFVCLSIVGVALVPLLPVKLAPSRTLPAISVSFSMPGNAPRIVEAEATSKIESMLARVKGIRGIHSTSGNGRGSITIQFDKHTSIDVARFEVSTIIRQVWPELPRGVTYPSISVSHSDAQATRPFMTYTINSAASPIVIQRYAENVIKTALGGIGGIYSVSVSGATPMEWQLEYDALQLETVGVTVNDIRQAISQYYAVQFLGMAETGSRSGISSWTRITMLSEVEKNGFDPSSVFVANQDGALIRLDQLVKVIHTESAPSGYYRINGLNSIYLSLTADESANQLHLSGLVKKKMAEIEAGLPPGYEIHASYDATDYIKAELRKVYVRGGMTMLILLLFVLLMTRNIRYLLLIGVSLFIDLAVASIFYYFLKIEIQLYSLAGITISLSLIIDNAIIMTDHMVHKGNRKAIMPILTATVTSIGALSMIFLLDEKLRLNLQDFAVILIINLMVSFFVALWFVPAMFERVRLVKRGRPRRFLFFSPVRLSIRFTRLYERMICLMNRRKWISFVAVVLLFGLPVFLLPEKINQENPFASGYNKIAENVTYKEKVKPLMNKILGGTWRLFAEKVYRGSYFTRKEETILNIYASMPNGTTLPQMNNLIVQMERFLSTFPEIRQFQTSISSARQASISVFFRKEEEQGAFPYELKNKVVSRALELGGGSWSVSGLEDQGFSNDVRETPGSYRVKLYGYNYDELSAWTDTLKNRLLSYSRIKEILVNSNYARYKDDYQEFSFALDREWLATRGLLPGDVYRSLQPVFTRDMWVGSVVAEGENQHIVLGSKQSKEYDIWAMEHIGRHVGNKFYKLGEVAAIEKGQAPREVGKENQQYRMVLQYDYIGSPMQGDRILDRELKEFNEQLPMGYSAGRESSYWGWGKQDNKQYYLIGLLAAIIFMTTSILFNSLKQPFAIIFIIPVSFIGIFLTFYWFKLNFDQGGFASFILLSALTVNASIYILDDYNRIRKQKPLLPPVRIYLKAWNNKIIPIFLTVISTILGFIPFMVGTQKEGFWFPLAAGTIGGLIMSVIGIWILLPLLLIKRNSPL
ncbi:MAG: efflux RND transporter permease subunit [Proteiniphilum sp.]